MGTLNGRRIVLGVTGGIAAYKAVEVCRRLVDAGAHVIPVLTEGGSKMVGETTFSALASEPAKTSLWHDESPIPHTRLGQSADLVLVCPATARVLADIRNGRSGDLLTATVLATRAPVVVAPAMHTEMWEQESVQENIAVLARRGVVIVPPEEGRLAGGDIGAGRLAEPETVVAVVERVLSEGGLVGRKVVVTAGGTREPIDAVRFVGNRSSGKQGGALAAEAALRGADVVLITTRPDHAPAGDVRVVVVETAAEMAAATELEAAAADVVIMAAAVADFRPARAADHKLKKDSGVPSIELVPTVDILAGLGAAKRPGQVLVGFAAETSDLAGNAAQKLARKNLDLIVANDVSKSDVGFEHDTNEVVVLDARGTRHDVPLTTKREVARVVLDAVQSILTQTTRE